MLKELMYKWFGLEPMPCDTCEVLRSQLEESNRERRELLNRLLDRDKPEPPQLERENFQPIRPQHVPWSVRQQMLEAEDRKKAELLRNKEKEIDDLEKELGISGSSGE